MSPLSPQEQATLLRGFNDHQKFCAHLRIANKEGITIPYKASPGGLKLSKAIRAQETAGKPVRIVCLKASQVWMSSSTATEVFHRVPFFSGRRAIVLADSDMHTKLVYGYYDQYVKSYSENPYGSEYHAAVELPPLVSATEDTFEWANGSVIACHTAYNPDVCRSRPYNWAHLSEAAFYRSLGGVMLALMQRVPLSRDSGVIVESTANGMGGDFYDLCQQAKGGRSGWGFVFFAWWEHPENVCSPDLLGYSDNFQFQKSLTRDELIERQKYNLTLNQLAWRRYKIETDCGGRIERFRQEQPGNSEEAFQASGRTIFDMAALSRMPLVEQPTRGRLELFDVGIEKRIQFIFQDGGELSVYRNPQPGGEYCIGVDHAEGIDPGAKQGKSDPDWCSASVIDCKTGEQVAKLRERYEPGPWAERIYLLGKWYNWAFLAPERKAVGKAVIGKLLEMQYPVELIYAAERDPSDRRPALLQELGYETNTVSRPYLVSTLENAIRDMAIQLHDAQSIAECRGFVRKPSGREEGMQHDDDVFALALAVVGLAKARRAHQYRVEQQRLAFGRRGTSKPVRYGQRVEDDDDD